MITIAPAGVNTTTPPANSISINATIKEKLCRQYCVNSTVKPQIYIEYVKGVPELNGTTVFVPISVVITIIVPGENSNINAVTRLYTENFTLAFQGQTSVPTTITIKDLGRSSEGTDIICCKARTYTIHESLLVSIS